MSPQEAGVSCREEAGSPHQHERLGTEKGAEVGEAGLWDGCVLTPPFWVEVPEWEGSQRLRKGLPLMWLVRGGQC